MGSDRVGKYEILDSIEGFIEKENGIPIRAKWPN